MLERRDKGKLHGLALVVASLGRCIADCEPQRFVRVGLDPHRLDERLAGIPWVGGRRPAVGRKNALGPPCDLVEAGIGRDPVEPRVSRASTSERGQAAPGAQEGLLERVLGVLQGAQHAVAVGVKRCAVRLDEATKGVLVAVASRFEQPLLLQRARRRGNHLTSLDRGRAPNSSPGAGS